MQIFYIQNPNVGLSKKILWTNTLLGLFALLGITFSSENILFDIT